MQKGYGGTFITVAYLHDVVEDCGIDIAEIKKEFGATVATSVDALTKKFKGTDKTGFIMYSYIVGIRADVFAKNVKLADRLHNLLTAIEMDESFKLKYIRETEDYYMDLAKGSLFEDDMKSALLRLKQSL
jgi:(p)ppGpp synthase/HD superfamily hydrolase